MRLSVPNGLQKLRDWEKFWGNCCACNTYPYFYSMITRFFEKATQRYPILMLYLLLLVINFMVLLALTWLSIDELVSKVDTDILIISFFKYTGLTVIIMVALLVAYSLGIHFKFSKSKQIQYALYLTLLISGYAYVTNVHAIVRNNITASDFREQLASKIHKKSLSPVGYYCDSLSYKEYETIRKYNWFPTLQPEANYISFSYIADGFLPDYTFILSYYLKTSTKVDSSFAISKHTIQLDTLNQMIKVSYVEFEK